MDRHRIDLWLSPATARVASCALSPTGPQVMGIPWTHAGLPTLSLSAGRDAAGLLVGLQELLAAQLVVFGEVRQDRCESAHPQWIVAGNG
jgi:Asp-tRNA(Asn)/Glu-tRNA(Gln) amidotransferase A subunit family amidase